MNEKLKSKIAGVICDETDLGLDVSAELAEKIAAIVDRDCIEIKVAVKRLIKWATPGFDGETTSTFQEWWWQIEEIGDESDIPTWLKAIHDGNYTPAAIEEGLRDLFVTLLGGTDGNDDEPKS